MTRRGSGFDKDSRARHSRRRFLATSIAGAVTPALGCTTASVTVPQAGKDLPLPGQGSGEPVIIAGAGPCGLTAAYRLRQAGRRVMVVEAWDRVGGRTLTLRPGDRLQERSGPVQQCRFEAGQYLNAGAGRLPHYHDRVLGLCREVGVPLEPFIFNCRENMLQSDTLTGGKPVAFRHFEHELRGHVGNLLSTCADPVSGNLSALLSKDPERYGAVDAGEFHQMLQHFSDLRDVDPSNPDSCAPRPASAQGAHRYRYCGTDRVGYTEVPGAGRQAGQIRDRFTLEQLLRSNLADDQIFADLRIYWQSTHMQPVGGMDQIARHLAAKVGQQNILLSHAVVGVKTLSPSEVEVTVRDSKGELRRLRGSHFISTIAPRLYAPNAQDGAIDNDFQPAVRQALSEYKYVPACKVGWQARRRFWEEENIYGGISWTDARISQIWYPSSEYHSTYGTLTGAYNRGGAAQAFGEQSVKERLQEAWAEGQKMHPGSFAKWVDAESGVSIAWQNMPHHVGGWAEEPPQQAPGTYERLLSPSGRTYFSGDYLSHTPGWIEGAVRSAELVVSQVLAELQQAASAELAAAG